MINAIGNSPNWKSTVIFVIWDDWGGFYDHVVPPLAPDPHLRRLGRGVRIPFLVISPYLAKPGGVVSTEGHPGSIMRFADDLYGLQPLTEFDAQAPDLRRLVRLQQAAASVRADRRSDGSGRLARFPVPGQLVDDGQLSARGKRSYGHPFAGVVSLQVR